MFWIRIELKNGRTPGSGFAWRMQIPDSVGKKKWQHFNRYGTGTEDSLKFLFNIFLKPKKGIHLE